MVGFGTTSYFTFLNQNRMKANLLSGLLWLFPFLLISQTTINYGVSNADFPNPERGFYYPTNSNDGPLNAATIANWRNEYTPWLASYDVHSTLMFRYFMLTDFVSSPISAAYLTSMGNDFNAVRQGGAKIILRFSYTNTVDSGCGSPPCSPYGDASKAQVLAHIAQLAPVLQANSDVIAAVQVGFFGIWGENYYTDHFGDASAVGSLSATNWSDRNEVVQALLDALPDERMIQIRYPQAKQKFLYGTSASTDPLVSPPLTSATAFSGSDAARIGFHNDCFLASNTDFGTYVNYDPWSAAHTTMTPELRSYKDDDSAFVVVGGETCAANVDVSGDETCASSGGRADTDLALFGYSYLNAFYNNSDVNNSWDGVCLDDIKRRLGYRFEMISGTYTDEAQAGQVFSLDLDIYNDGYAVPFNPRAVEIILRNTISGAEYFASSTDDPRTWASGLTTNLNAGFCIPVGIPNGNYEVLLHLPDPEFSLYGNPDYSIRLANTLPDNSDVWEASTGYNKLGHNLMINGTAASPICTTEPLFSTDPVLPVEWLSFYGKRQVDNSILLQWEVLEYLGTESYQIERSFNGNDFEFLGKINARNNNSSTPEMYFHNDKFLGDRSGYYRVKQMDENGYFEYSKTIFISGKNELGIQVFPNPSRGNITIKTQGEIQGNISIINADGKMVYSKEIQGENINDINLNLPSGVYTLILQSGKLITREKLLIVDK